MDFDAAQLRHREDRRFDRDQRLPRPEPALVALLASVLPSMMFVASLTIGTPVTLLRNGTVRDERGLTSSTIDAAGVNDVLDVDQAAGADRQRDARRVIDDRLDFGREEIDARDRPRTSRRSAPRPARYAP